MMFVIDLDGDIDIDLLLPSFLNTTCYDALTAA